MKRHFVPLQPLTAASRKRLASICVEQEGASCRFAQGAKEILNDEKYADSVRVQRAVMEGLRELRDMNLMVRGTPFSAAAERGRRR